MSDTKLDTIKGIFNTARTRGLCKTQKDFADLVGLHPSTVSLALKGEERYLTDVLVLRIESWARENGLMERPQPAEPDIIIPAATAKMYADMAESIRILSELVAAQQRGEKVAATGSNG